MNHIEILWYLHDDLLILRDVIDCYVLVLFIRLSLGRTTESQLKSAKRTNAVSIQYTP